MALGLSLAVGFLVTWLWMGKSRGDPKVIMVVSIHHGISWSWLFGRNPTKEMWCWTGDDWKPLKTYETWGREHPSVPPSWEWKPEHSLGVPQHAINIKRTKGYLKRCFNKLGHMESHGGFQSMEIPQFIQLSYQWHWTTLATGWAVKEASVSTPQFPVILQAFSDQPLRDSKISHQKKKTWQDFENMPLSPSMMPQSPSLMPQSPSLIPQSPSLQGPVRSFQVKNTFIDVEDSPKEGTWGPETSRRCRSMPPPPMLDTPSEDDDTNTTPADDEVSSPLSVGKTHYSAARMRFTDVVTIQKCFDIDTFDYCN